MKKKGIIFLTPERIRENLSSFEEDRHPLARYASFDYCFNYFQEFKDKKDHAIENNIQISCLHLGFYLASWGMYRGSADILQKSVKIFEPVIKYIASKKCNVWGIDVDNYSEDNILKLIECHKIIDRELNIDQKDKGILVTKIMLGVFGNVPAFDTYFKSGSNLGTFNKHALEEIFRFYNERPSIQKIISEEATRINTFKYNTGKMGGRSYTKAKIVDMIFFIEGYNMGNQDE